MLQCGKFTRSVQKVSDFFSLSNCVQSNHSCKAWAHTHTFMRNCEKFQADCASHSFSVKCLLRSHNTSLAILYFQETFTIMTEQIGQRYCIKFCQKLGDTQIETIRKIQQMFGDVALSPTQTKEWFKRFKNGRESVESEPRSGRPCTSRNKEVKDQVREEVLNDRRVTVREIAVEVEISTGSVHSILTEDLRMRRVSAKFVPKLLTEEQKELRKEICKDMLDCANHDPEFMKTIITGDETWVYGYDPEKNSNLPNGSIRNHHDPKKHGRFGAR